jgi:phospholipase/carboxylesterase
MDATPISNTGRRTLSLAHRVRGASAETADPRPPMLLLLHGVGSNELAMAALMDWFDNRFIVVSARAPIELEPFSFAWLHVTFTPDGPIIEGEEAIAACRDAAAFVDEAVAAYGADPERVYLAGFSQGGIVGLGTLLTAPEKVAGVVCMSGRLPPELVPHIVARDRLRDRSVLLVHGVHDQTLDIAYARSARALLETLPVDLDYREFDMGHTTTDESMAVVAGWLTGRLGS